MQRALALPSPFVHSSSTPRSRARWPNVATPRHQHGQDPSDLADPHAVWPHAKRKTTNH